MENSGDFLLFLGKWHPLVVHLPIGILLMAFVLALLSRKQKYAPLAPAIALTLLFGSVSAVAAGISGYLLSLGGGYNERTLSLHQWSGVGTAIVSVVCWGLYRANGGVSGVLSPLRRFRLGILGLMVVLLCITGHFGGTLTHGEGYLTEAMPAPLQKWFGGKPEEILLENVQEAAVYPDIIQPIFQQRCQSCHGTKKQEGDLALHTFTALMEGGESGPAIVAGDTLKSELFRRLTLPLGDEERMPPKGRTPITDAQIQLIAWWIGAGAPQDKRVKELEQPDPIQPLLLSLEGRGARAEASGDVSYDDIPPARQEVIDKLLAKGVKVVPVAEQKNQLIINAINYPAFSDADGSLLRELGANVAELKLGGTQISDAILEDIGQLSGLRRLSLENTTVTDRGLERLKDCQQLRYLNLVNTQVTDGGIDALHGLPQLREVYLYGTKVTQQGIAVLRQTGKGIEVDAGNYRLPALPSDTIVY